PSGHQRFSAAIETCPIQSCNRFTASSWRLAISALMSPSSSPTARELKAAVITANAESKAAIRILKLMKNVIRFCSGAVNVFDIPILWTVCCPCREIDYLHCGSRESCRDDQSRV